LTFRLFGVLVTIIEIEEKRPLGRIFVLLQDIITKNSQKFTPKVKSGTEANGYVNYRKGANISGFIKVADAIRSCGIV